MSYVIKLFGVLAILFIIAINLVNKIYRSGHQIPGFLIGFISFVILILAQILSHNQMVLTIAQVVFLFGCILFFMASTKNYNLARQGKGKGWLAKRVRRLREANKK